MKNQKFIEGLLVFFIGGFVLLAGLSQLPPRIVGSVVDVLFLIFVFWLINKIAQLFKKKNK